jgi:apolipoprotein N-acyltransferase
LATAPATSARSRLPSLCALGAVSGALLFVSDYPVHAWHLQLIALVPLLVGLDRLCRSSGAAALAGLALGVLYTGPLLLALEFPLAMGLGLAAYLTLVWVLLAVAVHRALRWPGVWGALGAGAAAALVEWLDFSALPVWGTAQCFARVWTAAPRAIGLVAFVGVTGLVFVLVAGQALVVRLATAPARRRPVALALVALVAVAAALSAVQWRRSSGSAIKVAAMGWTANDLARRRATAPGVLFERLFRPYVEEAARQGARLVVSPEVGLFLSAEEKRELLPRIAALARRHGLTLAVGIFDRERNDNRILFFDATGAPRGEYVKTHLIPLVETYRGGDGQLALLGLDAAAASAGSDAQRARQTWTLGGMICQDDNFTDLARAYGRRRAQLVAVPTNDWKQVKDYHLENALFRAVENDYVIVRGASNGISAIVSARGEVLARRDHFTDGPGVIVAEVSPRRGGTLYSWAGDWLVAACLVGLVIGVGLGWRRRRSS